MLKLWQAQRLCHTKLQGWESWHIIAIDARFWCYAQENLRLPTAPYFNTIVCIRLTETLLHASKRAKMSSNGNQKMSDELHSFGAITQQSFLMTPCIHRTDAIRPLQKWLHDPKEIECIEVALLSPHLSITDMFNSD